MEKTMLEYVRSGEFLFDSATYLKMDIVNLLFCIHMHIIVIVIIAIIEVIIIVNRFF